MTHELKSWPEYFVHVLRGEKTFELRVNDRYYSEGDTLILKEWHPIGENYSGREIECVVSYLVRGGFGLKDGWVCMAIKLQ